MSETIKASNLSIGDRVDIGNGLFYEVEQVFENKGGRIKFILFPFQNKMSARKRITLSENKDVKIVELRPF